MKEIIGMHAQSRGMGASCVCGKAARGDSRDQLLPRGRAGIVNNITSIQTHLSLRALELCSCFGVIPQDMTYRWSVEANRWRVEVNRWRVEAKRWRVEVNRWRVEVNRWRVDVKRWRVEVNRSRIEVDRWRVEVNRWRVEVNRWRVEVNRWRVESNHRRIEGNRRCVRVDESASERGYKSEGGSGSEASLWVLAPQPLISTG